VDFTFISSNSRKQKQCNVWDTWQEVVTTSKNNHTKVLSAYSFPQMSHLKNWQLSHFFCVKKEPARW